MELHDTKEFPIAVEAKSGAPKQDSRLTVIVFTSTMVLSIIMAIGLVVQAFAEDDEPETDLTEVTTNEERVAAADIQLEDLVEDPSEEQLELMIESDFFSEVGLAKEAVDRLNEQAEDALEEIRNNIPAVDLPENELTDFNEQLEQAQDLLDQIESPNLEGIADLADQFGDFS